MLGNAHANLFNRTGTKRHVITRRSNNASRAYGISIGSICHRLQRAKVSGRFFRGLIG